MTDAVITIMTSTTADIEPAFKDIKVRDIVKRYIDAEWSSELQDDDSIWRNGGRVAALESYSMDDTTLKIKLNNLAKPIDYIELTIWLKENDCLKESP